MTDEQAEPTPEQQEAALAIARHRAWAKHQEANQCDDAERRRTDAASHAERNLKQMQRWAANHGIDLDAVDTVERTGCDVCDGSQSVDDAHLVFADTFCDQHRDAVVRRVADRVLRPIIPEDLHDAAPEQLRPELRGWQPSTGGVYLYGPVGTGKSFHAAILVKLAWVALRKASASSQLPSIVWRNVPIMMDDIAATFGKGGGEYDMRAVRDAAVLVLDDMGMADNMPFAVRKLYALLEHRLHAKLCTIVTSNRNLDSLGKHLDSPQIASRLSMMCAQLSYDGLPDMRPGQAPRLAPP